MELYGSEHLLNNRAGAEVLQASQPLPLSTSPSLPVQAALIAVLLFWSVNNKQI